MARIRTREAFNVVRTEGELALVARELVGSPRSLTPEELAITSGHNLEPHEHLLESLARRIAAGEDPLGDLFLDLRSQVTRRQDGAVYTPDNIVESMLTWAEAKAAPDRVVDPGAGSGRFVLAAASRFPKAKLVAVETDPLAALLLRANASVRGVIDRLHVIVADYRLAPIEPIAGRTLFIGNPPYVRHHHISSAWKEWLTRSASALGLKVSKLAGLHVHFLVRTAELARTGDVGVFVTSSEWLDVNYGSAMRTLLANQLGIETLNILDADALPFDGTYTTAAIVGFEVGLNEKHIHVRRVKRSDLLGSLTGGRQIGRELARTTNRWSDLVTPQARPGSRRMQLGDLFGVHRGQVTGANRVWIAGAYPGALPANFLFPSVTRANELLSAAPVLSQDTHLRCVIDLPVDLDLIAAEQWEQVQRFLDWARANGADRGYVARHRPVWWSVGLRSEAPILVTYMGRRPPVFVVNKAGARHINIAHGLYPRQPMDERLLLAVVTWLNSHVSVAEGRTYAGGLTKFEPRELERLRLPTLEELDERAASLVVGGVEA